MTLSHTERWQSGQGCLYSYIAMMREYECRRRIPSDFSDIVRTVDDPKSLLDLDLNCIIGRSKLLASVAPALELPCFMTLCWKVRLFKGKVRLE